MTTANLLDDACSPACGSTASFNMEATSDAVDTDALRGKPRSRTWGNSIYLECGDCSEYGPLLRFKPKGPTPEYLALVDTLLVIKAVATRHNDSGQCLYTLLELIEAKAVAALAKHGGAAQ